MSTTLAFRGMFRASVAATISPEAMVRVSQLSRSDMVFGEHWLWEHGGMLLTPEGLRLAVEHLRADFPADALALQTEVAARAAAAGPAEPLPAASLVGERMAPTPSAFWWHQW